MTCALYCDKIRKVSGKVKTEKGDIKVEIDRKLKFTIDITIPEGLSAAYIDEFNNEFRLKAGRTSFALRKPPEFYSYYEKLKPRVTFAKDI